MDIYYLASGRMELHSCSGNLCCHSGMYVRAEDAERELERLRTERTEDCCMDAEDELRKQKVIDGIKETAELLRQFYDLEDGSDDGHP